MNDFITTDNHALEKKKLEASNALGAYIVIYIY